MFWTLVICSALVALTVKFALSEGLITLGRIGSGMEVREYRRPVAEDAHAWDVR
jgi:hypothetical protein